MLAAFAEEFGHQIGGSIEHLRMSTEPFGAMDVAFNADNLLDFFQIAGGGLELGDGVQGALAGGLITVLLGEFAAELAGVGDFAITQRQLTGSEYKVAGANPGLIGSHGGGCLGQCKSEFGEFGFDAHVGEGTDQLVH